MKTKIALLLILVSIVASAQNQRFIYELNNKKDSNSSLITKENYHLDIQDNVAKYYIRDYFVADSLMVNNIPFPVNMKLNTSTITSHDLGKSTFHELDLLENTVLKVPSQDSQDWKLVDEKKKLGNLTVQKATTNWGGRSWTAWFAPEIPIHEGPYKFRGLPGLIVELSDSGNNYYWLLAKSHKLEGKQKNSFLDMAEKIAVPTTREKYVSTKLKFYESPVNFIQNSVGSSNSSSFYLNDGTVVNKDNKREINEQLRSTIKKYNNPVDLKSAIPYP